MVMKDEATEDNFEQFPSGSGGGDFLGNLQKTKYSSQILLLGCHFFEDIFLLKRARNVPPTLVLRAQCSTYLYTPNLHNHERSEWSYR